jgi:predicted dehydrogenase
VTTTTAEHAYLTMRALESGKHVICNKPLAMSTAQAEQMIATARQCERILLVLQGTWRYWPMSMRAKQIIWTGEIGHVLQGHFWTKAPLPRDAPASVTGG